MTPVPDRQVVALAGGKAKRVLVVMGLVAIIGVALTVVTGALVERRERANLLRLALTAVTAVRPEEVGQLRGNAADLASPTYVHLKDVMTRQRAANEDTRFVYLMGQNPDNTLFFYVDSEPSDSADYSPPGDSFDQPTAEDIAAFDDGEPFVEGPARDEWGEWVSALVPIRNPQDGSVMALLGMDIGTALLKQRVREAQALPAVVTLLILTLMFGYYLRVRRGDDVDRAKTEFVSLAANQLRTPLASIGWYAEMIQSGEAGTVTEQQREFVGQIHDNAQRMARVVNALLNVTRVNMRTFTSDPQAVDVVQVADEVIAEFGKQIGDKRLVIQRNYPGGGLPLQADDELLRIILQNLLSNAVKYTPPGGTITVSLSKDPGFAHIVVADTGYGIPKSQQSKIFTKLFRGDNVKQQDRDGSGLGLYLVKSIVSAHGGKVWFASVENRGSTFYVDLPASGMRKVGTKPSTPKA